MDDFWTVTGAILDRIEAERPSTVAGVLGCLGAPRRRADGLLEGFFAGSGGGRSLYSALFSAGWALEWVHASYFYAVRHPVSGAVLTYVEGDVIEGDHRPVREVSS